MVICEIMMADLKAKDPLRSKVLSEPGLTDLDDTHRSVLNIVAENLPCTEPKLFITAIISGLECFSGVSLGDLRERLGQYVQDLKAAGLVEIVDNEFVLADTTGAEDDDVLDQTEENQQSAHIVDEVITDEVITDEVLTDEVLVDETPADQGHSEEEPLSGTRQASAAETDAAGSAPELPTGDVAASLPEGGEDADILDLTGELELELVSDEPEEAPTDQDAQARGAETEDIASTPELPTDSGGAGSPQSAEEDDILDLTGEIEAISYELEEVSTDQERAEEEPLAGPAEEDGAQNDGEPTREEIVAAMRRFVSEEEPENAQGQTVAAPQTAGKPDT